jgi:hypothetical protein
MEVYNAALQEALRTEYQEIFWITAGMCALGALLALAVGARRPAGPDDDPIRSSTRHMGRDPGNDSASGDVPINELGNILGKEG